MITLHSVPYVSSSEGPDNQCCNKGINIHVPPPLSVGEILNCSTPSLSNAARDKWRVFLRPHGKDLHLEIGGHNFFCECCNEASKGHIFVSNNNCAGIVLHVYETARRLHRLGLRALPQSFNMLPPDFQNGKYPMGNHQAPKWGAGPCKKLSLSGSHTLFAGQDGFTFNLQFQVLPKKELILLAVSESTLCSSHAAGSLHDVLKTFPCEGFTSTDT